VIQSVSDQFALGFGQRPGHQYNRHLSLDGLLPPRLGDRNPMMPIFDEVDFADFD
jgi:hypothetical protein